MADPVVKPEIPYTGKIPGGLLPGRMCRIQGVSHPEADRFNINLQTGQSSNPRDDTALHMSIRHNEGYIARNSYKDGEWGEEMGNGDLPIGHTESWEILILVDEKDYKIAVNGQHFTEFPHRIPISEVSHILIDGDVTITLISWEGIMGLGGTENSSKASQVNSQEGGFAPPQQGEGGYAPPQQFGGGYGPPQQQSGYFPPQGYGGYGPAPGYGAPPQGYGPPAPPGAEPQSGFGNFLDTAQSLLAGAIKSGAAEKLISGFRSGGSQPQGQGYAHNNAKYGIYPELPQDMNLNLAENKQQPGPVENLLSSLLSGGNNQQQTPGTAPNPQQNKQVDIGALLSNLLGNHQAAQVPPSHGAPQPNPAGAQPTQGADIGAFLSNLLSANQQGSQQGQPGTQQAAQNSHGVDLSNLLSGLLSGTATRPLQENTGDGGARPASGGTQSQPDFGSMLSGLLSGGSHQNPPGPGVAPGHPQAPSGQSQPDFGSLLSGLLSGGSHQNPPNPGSAAGHPQQPGPQQSRGIDLNSLLSSLLSTGDSTGGEQQPGGYQSAGGYQNPGGYQNSGGYQNPGGNQNPGGYQPPKTGSNIATGPGNSEPPRPVPGRTPSEKASKQSDQAFDDVSDQLEREIARDGGGGTTQAPPSGGGGEQYGYYPHPAQEQRGPLENLLSGFLSGGGGGQQPPRQQPHASQFGGGESIGGLGSMSGLLENFAGQLFNPKNPNQRQN